MNGLMGLPSIVISKTDSERRNNVAEAARGTVPDIAE